MIPVGDHIVPGESIQTCVILDCEIQVTHHFFYLQVNILVLLFMQNTSCFEEVQHGIGFGSPTNQSAQPYRWTNMG